MQIAAAAAVAFALSNAALLASPAAVWMDEKLDPVVSFHVFYNALATRLYSHTQKMCTHTHARSAYYTCI